MLSVYALFCIDVATSRLDVDFCYNDGVVQLRYKIESNT